MPPRVRARYFSALMACAALMPLPAQAQVIQRLEQRVLDTITNAFSEIEAKDIDVRLGAGPVFTAPNSGKATLHPVVPLFSFHYKNWFQLDENQIVSNLIAPDTEWAKEGFRAGPMMKVDFGRKRLNAQDVDRLGRVGTSVELGAFASWSYGPARARVRVRQDVADGHGGTVVELDVRSGLFRTGKLGVGVQLQAAWSSRSYMQAFYGVTPAQARETHLPVFTPGPGFRDLTPSIAAEYRFNRQWSAIGTVQYVHLLGDAAASPVPRTRGAGGRTNMGAFVVYAF